MSIKDEIEKQKQINNQKALLQSQKHLKDVELARKMIPEIAEEVKRTAVLRAANADAFKYDIRRGGLFGTKKYMVIEVKFSSYSTIHTIKPYAKYNDYQHYLYLKLCPEIYRELENAINAKGLKNTRVSKGSYNNDVFFETEIDLY